jgi:hypothetical protein
MKRCGLKLRQALADLETVIWRRGWTVRETWPILQAIARGEGTSEDEGLRALGDVAGGLLKYARQTGQGIGLLPDHRNVETDKIMAAFFPLRAATDAAMEKAGVEVARRSPLPRHTRPMVFIFPLIEDERLYQADLNPSIGYEMEKAPEPASEPSPEPSPVFFPALTN